MSTESIQALFDKINQDPELQKRVTEIRRKSALATAQAISQLSEEIGAPVSSDELIAAAKQESVSLSDQELSDVSGGLSVKVLFFDFKFL